MWDQLAALAKEHETVLWWLAAGSAGMLLLSLISLPVIAVCLPQDFIPRQLSRHTAASPGQPGRGPRRHGWRLVGRVAKNTAGVLLAAAGLAMLVLPGQGLLTLAFALLLLDLPGKRRLENRLLRSPRFQKWINRLRQRFGRPPLNPPPTEPTAPAAGVDHASPPCLADPP